MSEYDDAVRAARRNVAQARSFIPLEEVPVLGRLQVTLRTQPMTPYVSSWPLKNVDTKITLGDELEITFIPETPQPEVHVSDPTRGLYNKFRVERVDGRDQPGQKHAACDYFVLDLTHDKFALQAIQAYAVACREEYPVLARDLLNKAKLNEADRLHDVVRREIYRLGGPAVVKQNILEAFDNLRRML